MTLELTILKSAQTKRPAWFVPEAAAGARMDMKKTGIKWSEIKSLSIEGLTVRVMYCDRKQVTYCFDSEAEMLELLDNRAEGEGGLPDQKHVFSKGTAARKQPRTAR